MEVLSAAVSAGIATVIDRGSVMEPVAGVTKRRVVLTSRSASETYLRIAPQISAIQRHESRDLKLTENFAIAAIGYNEL